MKLYPIKREHLSHIKVLVDFIYLSEFLSCLYGSQRLYYWSWWRCFLQSCQAAADEFEMMTCLLAKRMGALLEYVTLLHGATDTIQSFEEAFQKYVFLVSGYDSDLRELYQ